ncbi:hypothetical protein FRC08_001762 [Ceratobasidium sp. 394]|nr:hypothetical protein FRC08_001762 [Ceratobasidium sp. 394]KAG9091566.1 hypothetical protein FS749_016438 [Ceratobasidium sp. UAMH 11750]
MINVPSVFDAVDLSMKLSQHLFNIQCERYLRKVADEDPSVPETSSGAGNTNASDPDSTDPPARRNDPIDGNQGRDVPATEIATSSAIPGSSAVRP